LEYSVKNRENMYTVYIHYIWKLNGHEITLSFGDCRGDKLSGHEILQMIELLEKWKDGNLTFGECCELREFKYQFSDVIEEYWRRFKA
jgi:diphthamide synthase subunit DPH2